LFLETHDFGAFFKNKKEDRKKKNVFQFGVGDLLCGNSSMLLARLCFEGPPEHTSEELPSEYILDPTLKRCHIVGRGGSFAPSFL
jgi:hypothetical protein